MNHDAVGILLIELWSPASSPTQVNGHQLSGEELKRIGMALAAAAAPAWSARAAYTIDWVLRTTTPFFDSEALTAMIGLPRRKPGQHRNNAVGAAFAAASKRKTIVEVDRKKAEIPRSHSNKHGLWTSTGGGRPVPNVRPGYGATSLPT